MDSDDSDYNINNVAKSGSPRPSKKVIEEKEIGDGQDEKEKIKELLEAEEKQRKEEAKLMEEWKKK